MTTKRHGTTPLFAALDVATGSVIGKCDWRHRSAKSHTFLYHVQANVPPDLDVHFTPASASWLNRAMCFSADLTNKQIRRGVHRLIVEPERTITACIETVNKASGPFRWHKSADDILAAIRCFCCRTFETNAASTS